MKWVFIESHVKFVYFGKLYWCYCNRVDVFTTIKVL